MPDQPTVRTAVDRALEAYEALADLAEAVDDEWGYITDLKDAWTDRLEAIASSRGAEAIPAEAEGAVAVAAEEVGRIQDPHRAIDWLSTFPQVVCLALGERP